GFVREISGQNEISESARGILCVLRRTGIVFATGTGEANVCVCAWAGCEEPGFVRNLRAHREPADAGNGLGNIQAELFGDSEESGRGKHGDAGSRGGIFLRRETA